MFERQIEPSVVKSVIQSGTTVESCPEDTPYPSRLVMGWVRDRPVHVVVADNPHDEETIAITAYRPDSMRWDARFSRRHP
jgi:hypothetical protein